MSGAGASRRVGRSEAGLVGYVWISWNWRMSIALAFNLDKIHQIRLSDAERVFSPETTPIGRFTNPR
jgi:hypothetical protein